MYLRFSLSAFLWLLAALPTAHAAHPCASGTPLTGVLSKVFEANGFELAGLKQRYFLAAIHSSPFTKLGDHLGRSLTVWPRTGVPDRYGRLSVQAFLTEEARWIQGEFLESGLAVIYANKPRSDCLSAMRRVEREASDAGAGVWAKNMLLLDAADVDNLEERTGTFAVVEGRVKSVGNRRNRLYLNFGSNWAEDFTATIVKRGRGAYSGNPETLAVLEGRKVRIRGMIESAGGPLIRVFDVSQIDILPGN